MLKIRLYHPSDAGAVSRLIRTTMRISNSADYPMERLQPLIAFRCGVSHEGRQTAVRWRSRLS